MEFDELLENIKFSYDQLKTELDNEKKTTAMLKDKINKDNT